MSAHKWIKQSFSYFALYGIFLLLNSSSFAEVGSNWIEQWGIRWTFDKNISLDGSGDTYRYGEFVTGDYWIVGPVNIISINPPSQDVSGRIKNGSMINPAIGNTNGYDNQMSYNTYNHSLNVAFGVSSSSPLPVSVNSSLISTISIDTPYVRPQLDSAAILTVLASAAPAGSFRPPYCGTNKTIQFNKSDLNYGKLKNLAPVEHTPSLTQPYGTEGSGVAYQTPLQWFERPWIDHGTEDPGRFIRPLNNCPDYGREISRYTNWTALLLNLNFTQTDKEPLLVGITQYGIDLYRIVSLNRTSFVGNGTITSGRLLPILMAGVVLDSAEGAEALRSIGQKTGQYRYTGGYTSGNLPSDYVHFLETNQTHYVTQTDVDITNSASWNPDYRDYQPEPYEQSDIGKPEWGIRNARTPQNNNRAWNTAYRLSSSPVIAGTALVANIMEIKNLFNQPSMFDYADRYVEYVFGGEYDAWYANHPEGADSPDVWRYGANGFEFFKNAPFVKNMWDTYYENTSSLPTSYTISISSTNGLVAKSPDKTVYNIGEVVTLTASPEPEYTFGSWTGDASGINNSVEITMNSNKSITANFIPDNPGQTENLPQYLQAQWTFNEENGTVAYDDSGNNRTATLMNDPIRCTGILSNAVRFDGVNDYVSAGTSDLELTDQLTISAWIYVQSNGENDSLTIMERGQYVFPFMLQVTGNNISTCVRTDTGTDYLDSSGSLQQQQWYHIAMTYRPGRRVIYINGEVDLEDTSPPTGTLISNGDQSTLIGVWSNIGDYFNGMIDDVRIYNYALTDEDMADLYAATDPLAAEAITAHWQFDEGFDTAQSTVVSDGTGNNHTGTSVGSPAWGLSWKDCTEEWQLFNGTNQAVKISCDSMQAEAGTIAMKVQPSSKTDIQFLFGHSLDSTNRIWLYTVYGKLALGMGDNATLVTGIETLSAGTVYHIALTWDGSNFYVYVDGELKKADVYSGLTTLAATADIANAGTVENRTQEMGFDGIVDDVQIYSRALSAQEITTLFNTQEAKENRVLTFYISGQDQSGNPYTYTTQNLPAGATFDQAAQKLTWRPWYDQAGDHQVLFTSLDGADEQTVTLSVKDVVLKDWYRDFLALNGKL